MNTATVFQNTNLLFVVFDFLGARILSKTPTSLVCAHWYLMVHGKSVTGMQITTQSYFQTKSRKNTMKLVYERNTRIPFRGDCQVLSKLAPVIYELTVISVDPDIPPFFPFVQPFPWRDLETINLEAFTLDVLAFEILPNIKHMSLRLGSINRPSGAYNNYTRQQIDLVSFTLTRGPEDRTLLAIFGGAQIKFAGTTIEIPTGSIYLSTFIAFDQLSAFPFTNALKFLKLDDYIVDLHRT